MDELQLRRMMSAVSSLQAGYLVSVPKVPDPGPQYRGQLLLVPGGDGVADAIKVCRKKADGTWEWLDVTGLVTQSSFDAKFHGTTGHAHTGEDGDGPALDTYGSNANGYYEKRPDGVMECWWSESGTHTHPNALAGTVYYSNDITWTFPVPFVSPPMVIPAASNLAVPSLGAVTAAAVVLKSISLDSSGRTATVSARAIGRWK